MRRTLILGGTAWLGHQIAEQAADRGDDVVCLARGQAGTPPERVRLVEADRDAPGGYDAVAHSHWDLVIDVSRQPGQVRSAVRALADRARHWVYVSSCSVYADHGRPGADESNALLPAHPDDVAEPEQYGEGKVAAEAICVDALGERVTLARAGLIGGWGDGSDRFGYWPGRFAYAGDRSVLMPDAADAPTQTIDVGDLAAWLLLAGDERLGGAYNVSGERTPLGSVLDIAREVAGYTGQSVVASSEWLVEQGVEPFMGPRSLPLWLPDPDWAGFLDRGVQRAVDDGLVWRPLEETMREALAYERSLGLDRQRRAGLSVAEERELLDAWAR